MSRIKKKLTSTQFFLRRFIPLLTGAAIICAMGTAMLKIALKDLTFTSATITEFGLMCQAINEKNLNADRLDIMKFCLSLYSVNYDTKEMGIDRAIVAVDSETGEIVATSELTLFATDREEKGETPTLYLCDDKEVVDFCYRFSENSVIIDYDEIFVKDGKFIPRKITVKELTEISDGLGNIGEILDEKDFTPENTSDYEYISPIKLTFLSGTDPDSQLLKDMKERLSGKTGDELYEELISISLPYKNSIYANYDEVTVNGRDYKICIIATYDFWVSNLRPLLFLYGLVLIIVLIISFVWSKIAYAKYSARYDTDEIRRNMADSLAHDLKSPLMAISGYAENIAEDLHPEKARYYAEAIIENTAYMNRIISSTLSLSKTENVISLELVQVDVMAVCEELYKKYRPEAEKRGISFKAEGSLIISADKGLISQAIENLITNAVRYTSDNGSISIRAEGKKLTVKNTCEKADELSRINLTEPFIKGDKSRSERSGSGLGLAIAKTACERQKFRLIISPKDNEFIATIEF